MEKIRIDKWLWATRVYKTRTIATDACIAGKVKLNGSSLKPAYNLKGGEIIHVKKQSITFTFKVLGLLDKRKSAKEVQQYIENITPIEDVEKAKLIHAQTIVLRPIGLGRPTKKDRREIDQFEWEKYWNDENEQVDDTIMDIEL